jgi:signal transduction histidine kinase
VVAGPRAAAGRWIELARGRWTDERVLTNYALGRRMGAVDPRALGHALDGPRRIDRIPDAPAEVQTLAASFDAMLARLEEAFAALSQFSAELAHEFRTPLHILRQHARDRRWRPVAAAGRRGTTLRSAAALRRLWA